MIREAVTPEDIGKLFAGYEHETDCDAGDDGQTIGWYTGEIVKDQTIREFVGFDEDGTPEDKMIAEWVDSDKVANLVHRYNCHDELVSALEAMMKCFGHDSHCRLYPGAIAQCAAAIKLAKEVR